MNCSLCTTLVSWEVCDKGSDYWECSDDVVLRGHGFIANLNPTLPLDKTTDVAGSYQCFSLEVLFGAGKLLHGFARGCTFAAVDFCSGWVDGTEVISCQTCRSEDPNSCNGAVGSVNGEFWVHLVGILIVVMGML